MRVLIYGGRDFVDQQCHWEWLDLTMADVMNAAGVEDLTVISGRARGADTFGERWAHSVGFEVDMFPADWTLFGKKAGYVRNQQMLDSGVDLAIQFPGGRGTADMRSRLDRAGVRVVEYLGDIDGKKPMEESPQRDTDEERVRDEDRRVPRWEED